MKPPTLARRVITATAAMALTVGTPAVAFAHQVPTQASAPASQDGDLGVRPTSPTAYQFGETLAELEGEQLETTFLAEIIPHHQAAIEMAKLELERGTSPDIMTHAENIIANQQHQIDQFTRSLDQWYGLTPEEAMEQAPEEARQEMATLEEETRQMVEELRQVPAGEAFDEAFVRMMVPHHQAGIIEFLEPQSRAVHPELRVAASSGINTQGMQVADFLTWLSGRA